MCYKRLLALGHAWNHKRVYRVYCALRLNQVRRSKRRVVTRARVPLNAAAVLNDTWAMDFMRDTLYHGRQYRVFNVLDEGNRECLAIEIDTSLPSVRVTHVLDQLITMHGVPCRLRCDNGPEFIANACAAGVTLTASCCNSFNQANPIKTPTSNASIVAIAKKS